MNKCPNSLPFQRIMTDRPTCSFSLTYHQLILQYSETLTKVVRGLGISLEICENVFISVQVHPLFRSMISTISGLLISCVKGFTSINLQMFTCVLCEQLFVCVDLLSGGVISNCPWVAPISLACKNLQVQKTWRCEPNYMCDRHIRGLIRM